MCNRGDKAFSYEGYVIISFSSEIKKCENATITTKLKNKK
jgi:hypothetical protein